MRVGRDELTYRWARTGSRPRTTHDQRTRISTYLFGVGCCPSTRRRRRPRAAGLQHRSHAAPSGRDRHQGRSWRPRHSPPDQAGWHGAAALKVPSNISLLPLPPRSPELNPQENIWQFISSKLVLQPASYKGLPTVASISCCYAWNTLVDRPLENHVHRPPRWVTSVTHCQVGIKRGSVLSEQLCRFATAPSCAQFHRQRAARTPWRPSPTGWPACCGCAVRGRAGIASELSPNFGDGRGQAAAA